MVKHTETIGLQQPTNCLSVFDHFMKLALKGLTKNIVTGRYKSHIWPTKLKKTLVYSGYANVMKK